MATRILCLILLAHVLFFDHYSAAELSMTVCAGKKLDAGQQTPCPSGTVINVTRVEYGVRAGDRTCTKFPASTTCVRDLQEDHENHFRYWQDWCNGKIVCRIIKHNTLDIDCGRGPMESNMMDMRYECVPLKPEIQVSRTCRGDIISDISCPYGFTVQILDMYFVDYAGRDTCDISDTDYDCALRAYDSASHASNHIKQTCNGQASCGDLNLYAIGVWNTSCASRESLVTDQLVVHYRCQTGLSYAHRCPGNTFDELVCPSSSVLHFISLRYGTLRPSSTDFTSQECRGARISRSDCQRTIKTHPILETCTGQRSCVARASIVGNYSRCYSEPAQLVRLSFRCYHITEPEVTTSRSTPQDVVSTLTPVATTVPNTSNSDPHDLESETELQADSNRNLIPVIAVVAAVLGCAVFVLIVVNVIMWRRQAMILANQKQGTTAQDATYVNMASMSGRSSISSTAVTDGVPRIVRNSEGTKASKPATSKKPGVAREPTPADDCLTYEDVNPQSVNTQPAEYDELRYVK